MSKLERGKDTTQEIVESVAIRVGRIATIITTAVADVVREIGDAASDGLEMREAAKRAAADERRTAGTVIDRDEAIDVGNEDAAATTDDASAVSEDGTTGRAD